MRVAFLTNLSTRESLPVLAQLAASCQAELIYVFLYDTIAQSRKSFVKTLREFGLRRIVTKSLEVAGSRVRLVLHPFLPGDWCRARSAAELAVRQGIPSSIVRDMNHPEVQEELRQLDLDLLLVCVCRNILKQPILEVPRLGAVNVHPSLLPKYRGPTPIFWMLYHGEQQAGVTFQRMTPRIDLGPVVAQYAVPLEAGRSEQQVSRQLFALAAAHLDEALARLVNNDFAAATDVDAASASYHSYPTAQDRAELQRRQRRA